MPLRFIINCEPVILQTYLCNYFRPKPNGIYDDEKFTHEFKRIKLKVYLVLLEFSCRRAANAKSVGGEGDRDDVMGRAEIPTAEMAG
jgi:hypothetical protein